MLLIAPYCTIDLCSQPLNNELLLSSHEINTIKESVKLLSLILLLYLIFFKFGIITFIIGTI